MDVKNTLTELLKARVNELSKKLDTIWCGSPEWDTTYDEYCKINAELDRRYKEENIEKFEQFFYKHIYGKKWSEIDSEILDSYSDWHKDMFGYRPRSTDKDW